MNDRPKPILSPTPRHFRPLLALLLLLATLASGQMLRAEPALAQNGRCEGAISGRVLDEQGQGVAGARVTLQVGFDAAGNSLALTSVSENDGAYRFGPLCASEYKVYAMAATSAASARWGQHDADGDGEADILTIEDNTAPLVDIDIVLDSDTPLPPRNPNEPPQPGPGCRQIQGNIRGLVTDEDDNPVEGATVVAGASNASGSQAPTASTDADGRYTIAIGCAGSMRVVATLRSSVVVLAGFYDADDDGTPDLVTLDPALPNADGIDIQLSHGSNQPSPPQPAPGCAGEISGHIFDEAGQGVGAARVTLHGGMTANGSLRTLTALSAADGTYRFEALCAAEYRAYAMAATSIAAARWGQHDADGDGKADALKVDATTSPLVDIDIVLDSDTPLPPRDPNVPPRTSPAPRCPLQGAMKGRVSDQNGKPVAGVVVKLVRGFATATGAVTTQLVRTNANGEYAATGLCADRYLVSAAMMTMAFTSSGFYDPDGNGEPNFVTLDVNQPKATAIDMSIEMPERPFVASPISCPTCGGLGPIQDRLR